MIPAPRWNCDLRYEFPDFAHGHCRRTFFSINTEYNLRQNYFYALDNTETTTPNYLLLNLSTGMDIHIFGHNCIELTISCQNLLNKVYQPHLSRLKYTDNPGIANMGRNFYFKVNIPIDIHIKKTPK